MSTPPIPIKVVEVPMPPAPSPPPFYVKPKSKSSPCRWTSLAVLVLLVWLSASALIILHLGPECLFKKFSSKSQDDVTLKTDALKSAQLDDLSDNTVDSLGKLLNSAKLRQVVVLTADDDSEKSEKTNMVDNDLDTTSTEDKTQQLPVRIIDSSTDSLESTPYRSGNLGSMQGFFVPAEHLFGSERPIHPLEVSRFAAPMNRAQWYWPSSYEQLEMPRFMQAPPAFYPNNGFQSPNPYYNPFYRAQAFRPQFFVPQQTFQQQMPQVPQQMQPQQPQSFVQPQPAQQNPRPILDPNPLQWPQPQEIPSTTEASVKSDSNEIFRKVEEEAAKNHIQPQIITPSLGSDIRDEIYRQLQRQSQLLSGSQERPVPTWPQASQTTTTTEKPSEEMDIDEIYRKLQEQSQKFQQEKEKEKEEESAFEPTDVIEDSFPRIEKINSPELSTEVVTEATTEAPAPKRTTEDNSFFKFFEEQAAKMRDILDKQPEEAPASLDVDTKEEASTEAPMNDPKPALIFQDSKEPQVELNKETKETEVAWTKDQEPIQGETEDKSMVRAERTN